jgi:hypothetical protein
MLVLWLAGKLEQHRQVALQPRDAMAVIMPPGGMPYLQHQVGPLKRCRAAQLYVNL